MSARGDTARRSGGVRRWQGAGGLLAVALGLCAGAALGVGPARGADAKESDAAPTEYEVKAAYLYNFIRFAEWPVGAFVGAPDGVFVVTVLGDDPFGPALEEIFNGKQAYGRRLTVRRTRDPEQAAKSQMVFVSASMSDTLPSLVRAVGARSVLVVGDTPESARRGAMIGFRLDHNRVRFDINPPRAEERGLKLSSQLLRVARIVGAEVPKGP